MSETRGKNTYFHCDHPGCCAVFSARTEAGAVVGAIKAGWGFLIQPFGDFCPAHNTQPLPTGAA